MPTQTERRALKQREMAAAGALHLAESQLKAIREVLSASTVAAKAGLSRDTGYRVFQQGTGHSSERTQDALVEAVSAKLMDPAMPGFHALNDTAVALQGLGWLSTMPDESMTFDQQREFCISILEAMVVSQFSSEGYCARLFLHAAAMPASEIMTSVPLNGRDEALGRKILAQRLAAYKEMAVGIEAMVGWGMSVLGLRPRAGFSVEYIAALMHSLLDGCVMRMTIEPSIFTPYLVAASMIDLGIALSEPGGVRDPRRPQDEGTSQLFDHVVQTAIELWSTGGKSTAPLTLQKVCTAASASKPGSDVAAGAFPTMADLADSALRLLVDAGGTFSSVESDFEPNFNLDKPPAGAHRQGALTGLAQALGRLTSATTRVAPLFAILTSSKPERGAPFLDELRRGATRILTEPELPDREDAERRATVGADLALRAALSGDLASVNNVLVMAGYGGPVIAEPTVEP